MNKSLRSRNFAEWTTLAIALLIVAFLVGLLIHVWIQEDKRPPIVAVMTSTSEIVEIQGQFYVPFSVTNVGGGTAEAVQVVSELRINGEVVEAGEQTISFLSKNEEEKGMFIFTQDPKQGALSVRAASYSLP